MAMSWVWTGMVVLSLIFGVATGNLDAVASAALTGADSAIRLSLSMAGVLCLWTGVMEIMNVCGLSSGLARAFRPILRRLLPNACKDSETLAAVSANVSANLLGLGNAAGDSGGPPHGRGLRGRCQQRALYAGGAEHRLHPAAAGHRGLRPRRGGVRHPL